MDVLNSISALRGIVGVGATSVAQCLGYYTAGDQGGGLFYWDGASSAADDNGIVIKPTSVVGAGRWKRFIDQSISVRWFGAKGDAVQDDIIAIQAAIDYCANVNNLPKSVFFPAGQYRITSPINLSSGTVNRGYLRLYGESHPPLDGFRSSCIIGCTGSGKAIVEAIGTNTVCYENLTFFSSSNHVGYSTVGVFQSRATGSQGFGGRHFYKNVTVSVFVPQSANNNLGGIGMIFLDAEESVFENIEVWSALNVAHIHQNLITPRNVNATGIPQTTTRSFTYTPVHTDATPITSPLSNTVFTYTGECRLVSFGNISPNVFISSCGDVDFGHTFMQRGNTNGGEALGKYDFVFDIGTLFRAAWHGTAENARSLIALSGSLLNVHVNATIGNDGNASNTLAPILYYLVPTVATRDVVDSSFELRVSDNTQMLLTSLNESGSLAHLLRVTNVTFSSNLNYSANSISPEFTHRAQNLTFSFRDGNFFRFDRNIIETRIAAPLDKYTVGSPSVKIIRVYLPKIASGHQTATMSLILTGNVFTGGTADSGLPSVLAFEGVVNAANRQSHFDIKTNNAVRLIGTNLDVNTPTNSINNLALSTTVDNTNGFIDVKVVTMGSGDGIDNVILVASVKLFHSLGYNSSPRLDPVFTYGNMLY